MLAIRRIEKGCIASTYRANIFRLAIRRNYRCASELPHLSNASLH